MRISTAYQMLVSVYADWKDFLVNPNYFRSSDVISWAGFTRLRLAAYPEMEDFLDLVEHRQYSFQVVEDGGILQLYYSFGKDNSLQSATLALYRITGIPALEAEGLGASRYIEELQIQEESETSEGHYSGGIIGSESEASSALDRVSWIRFDYNPETFRGVLHGQCHLHLSGHPQSRILVKGVPSPKQFVEFIMASSYPVAYQKHRLGDDGHYVDPAKIDSVNIPIFRPHNHTIYEQMTHLRLPGH